ncbi:hypothetical protein PR048_002059 [Dryococelus australis]|uniref:Uncharacterized protein n=1 Tax=Dryococelus australis TaxID=614101 RepID=A0ABQ9IJA6_9NEOP|nr:hypothetical protein PR048_002059 [Dryococelus australis]
MWELIVQDLDIPTLQNVLTFLEGEEPDKPHFQMDHSKSTLSPKVPDQLRTTTGTYLVTPSSVVCVKVNILFITAGYLPRNVQGKGLSVLGAQTMHQLFTTSPHISTSHHHSLLHFTSVDIDSSDQQPHEPTESVEVPGNIVGKKKDPSAIVLS